MTCGDKIDINVASAEELDTVPELKGDGPEIVRYRGERGRFDSLRQLNEVPGLACKVPPNAPHLIAS